MFSSLSNASTLYPDIVQADVQLYVEYTVQLVGFSFALYTIVQSAAFQAYGYGVQSTSSLGLLVYSTELTVMC